MKHREHPGLLHYLIHCYDDPTHAPLGRRAAELYAQVAPDAGHAIHMTSHIFLALGLWQETVDTNIAALAAVNRMRAAQGQGPGALRPLSELAGLRPSPARTDGPGEGGPRRLPRGGGGGEALGRSPAIRWTPTTAWAESFANMRLGYLLESGDWQGEAADWPLPPVAGPGARLDFAFARALARHSPRAMPDRDAAGDGRPRNRRPRGGRRSRSRRTSPIRPIACAPRSSGSRRRACSPRSGATSPAPRSSCARRSRSRTACRSPSVRRRSTCRPTNCWASSSCAAAARTKRAPSSSARSPRPRPPRRSRGLAAATQRPNFNGCRKVRRHVHPHHPPASRAEVDARRDLPRLPRSRRDGEVAAATRVHRKVHRLDAQVGGTVRLLVRQFRQRNGHSFGGEYLELVPNGRIRHTASSTTRTCPGRCR